MPPNAPMQISQQQQPPPPPQLLSNTPTITDINPSVEAPSSFSSSNFSHIISDGMNKKKNRNDVGNIKAAKLHTMTTVKEAKETPTPPTTMLTKDYPNDTQRILPELQSNGSSSSAIAQLQHQQKQKHQHQLQQFDNIANVATTSTGTVSDPYISNPLNETNNWNMNSNNLLYNSSATPAGLNYALNSSYNNINPFNSLMSSSMMMPSSYNFNTPMMMTSGPFSTITNYLLGIQNVILSIGQVIQIVGMNASSLQQLSTSMINMMEHVLQTYQEQVLISSSSSHHLDTNSSTDEQQRRQQQERRKRKVIRYTITIIASYISYTIVRKFFQRNRQSPPQLLHHQSHPPILNQYPNQHQNYQYPNTHYNYTYSTPAGYPQPEQQQPFYQNNYNCTAPSGSMMYTPQQAYNNPY